MAVAVQAYFDGSGGAAGDRQSLTLAGYAGTPEFWAHFSERWTTVLAGEGNRPVARYLHMREANALRGEFARERGWTRAAVKALLGDVARCLGAGWGKYRGCVAGVACTVWLDDYERARRELPRLKEKEPEALCVDACVTLALMLLPEAPEGQGILGKDGSVELFFDRGEAYQHKIRRMWDQPYAKRSKPLQLVHYVGQADMRDTPPLQAADYLAWHTNRHLVHGDLLAGVQRVLSAPMEAVEYDYATLIKRFSRAD